MQAVADVHFLQPALHGVQALSFKKYPSSQTLQVAAATGHSAQLATEQVEPQPGYGPWPEVAHLHYEL